MNRRFELPLLTSSAALFAFADLAPRVSLGLTFVQALPAAHVAAPKGGVSYHERGGVRFRAALQRNELAYVFQRPCAAMGRGYKSVEASR